MKGTILTSPDGVIWTLQNSGTTESLCSVVYGNGQYVFVGSKVTGHLLAQSVRLSTKGHDVPEIEA